MDKTRGGDSPKDSSVWSGRPSTRCGLGGRCPFACRRTGLKEPLRQPLVAPSTTKLRHSRCLHVRRKRHGGGGEPARRSPRASTCAREPRPRANNPDSGDVLALRARKTHFRSSEDTTRRAVALRVAHEPRTELRRRRRPVSSTLEGRRATSSRVLVLYRSPRPRSSARARLLCRSRSRASARPRLKFVRLCAANGGDAARLSKSTSGVQEHAVESLASVRSTSRRWSACKWRCSRRSGPSSD